MNYFILIINHGFIVPVHMSLSYAYIKPIIVFVCMYMDRQSKMRATPCTHGKINEITQLYPIMCKVMNSEQALYTNFTITFSLCDHRMITCSPR